MTNAKQEFLRHIENRKILCATIGSKRIHSDENQCLLTTGWSDEDWNIFLANLDFEYDSGYGGQLLFGTIWYEDGTWSDRGEYDGSEWWEWHTCPPIPDNLNRIDKVRDKKLNQIL